MSHDALAFTVPAVMQLHGSQPSGFPALNLKYPGIQRVHCRPVARGLQ